MSAASSRWTGTIAWALLVLAAMTLIGYGIVRADWYLWLPTPAEQEETWIGSRFIVAGSALSLAPAVWAGVRGNPVWVTICVGLPEAFVGWAILMNLYNLSRHLAAVVSFPLALGRVVEVIRARGREP
ncbi:hypothetical protein [Pseudarthrobacter sp. IC2-21]|jgi:hypothetical protein|uniref:hypothetical protein n=1 Tax=Pseudarthrobacter sp. IC2-21 TaxID=3092262 RepID=UPI002A6B3ADC|nr:hypothetical protein [Pseudarthrobacter sp. IC2-21]